MPEMSRREFAKGLAGTVGASMLAEGGPAVPAPRPNIIFISSDQHSGRVLGCNGHPVVKTPNLDRLASLGVLFRNAYSGNPVCVPGRASMMTGMYASDVGSYCNSTPFDGRVPSWGNRLKQAGYYCQASGKLDLEKGADYGFQEIQTAHGHSEHPDITSLFRAPVCFRPEERWVVEGRFQDREDSDARLVQRGLDFLRHDAPKLDRPWALYLGMHMPHPRWLAQKKYQAIYPPERMPLPEIPEGYLENRHAMFQVLANFKNISTPIPPDRVRRARAAYFGMVSEVDELVGRLLEELEKTNRLQNTLIVYTSDHGEMLGEHGLWLKNVLLENAARVPLIMAGGGLPRGKVVETAVTHADAVATLLDLAGAGVPRELRGRSLAPLADGRPGDHPGFAFSVSHSEGNCTGSFMIRKGDWKYFYFTGDRPLLFNLKDDPGEFHDLADDKTYADLRRELHAQLASLLDPDKVTEQAFLEQERRLMATVKKMTAGEFYDELVGRLGEAQARIQTMKYYRGGRR
jgi:choline-sulfatase